MEMNEETRIPKMMTIREVAKTGLLKEYTLRSLVKQGKIPHIMCGNRAMINYDRLVDMLKTL